MNQPNASKSATLNRLLAAIMALALLVAGCGLGAYAAYIAMLAALIAVLNPRTWPLMRTAWQSNSVKYFLLAYAFIAAALVYRSFQGDDLGYIFDFLPLVLSLPVAAVFSDFDDSKWLDALFILALAGSATALGVVAYENFILSNSRPTGIENSPIHYSILALTIGFVAAGGFFAKPKLGRTIFLLGPVLGLSAALMTGTRAALPSLAFLIAASTVLVVVFYRIRPAVALAALAGGVVIAAIAIFGLLTLDSAASRAVLGLERAFLAMRGELTADTSMGYRLEQYRAFWPAFFEAPIFGQGWHNQLSAAYPFLSEFGQAGYDRQQWSYIHNEALSMTLGMGVLGLAAYILIYISPLLGLRQIRHDPNFAVRCYGITIILVGLFAGGLTDVLFMVELPKTFLVFISLAFLMIGRPLADRHPIV